MTLSIDIGKKNLGYAIKYTNDDISESLYLFDIFDISNYLNNKESIVLQRAQILHDFLLNQITNYNIQKVIIERQVQTNTIAMELMYSIVSILITMGINNIIIFDPKLKFTKLKQHYNTKNKEHKRLSIKITELLLQDIAPNLLDQFNIHTKKDDISDALIMLYLETSDSEKILSFSNKLIKCFN